MPKNCYHRLKNIIKESLGDFEWVKDIVPPLEPNFDYNGNEYWIDISHIVSKDERTEIRDYLNKKFPSDEFNFSMFDTLIKGIVIHCGDDEESKIPQKNKVCLLANNYNEDDYVGSRTIYVDCKDILSYIKYEEEKNKLTESLDDLSWIEQSESTFNPNFDFNGKEYWLDITNLNKKERKKIVYYIKKVLPNYKEFHAGEMIDIGEDYYKGIIIHCGAEDTDYKPDENLLCFSRQSYEDDYIDPLQPNLNQNNSIYVDGKEVLVYLNLIVDDEEELDESLEWSDKDTPFDEKDKSFENDPSFENDEDWVPNPERSYWKQGDAGGSSGGGDMNESNDMDWINDIKPDPLIASPDLFFRGDDDMYMTLDTLGHDVTNMSEMTMCELAINYGYRWSEDHEGWYHRDEVADFAGGNFPKGVRRGLDESDELDWIKDVSDQAPPMSSRKRIDLKDFIIELVKDSDEHMEVLQMLLNLDLFTPSDKYIHETGNNGEGFTPEEYDDFGVTNWLEGAWLEDGNSLWSNEPSLAYGEINELLRQLEWADGDHKWSLEDWHTNDYNLEYGSYQDRYIFKNKIDGSHFALSFDGSSHDGIEDNGDYLYQVYPKNVTKLVYESKIIKRAIKEEVDGIDTDPTWSNDEDMNESDELQWIKDVPDTIPPYDRRITIDLKDFIFDIAKDDIDLLHFLTSEDFIGPTEEYMRTGNGGEGFTPEDWDDFGYDEWAGDGDWVGW